MKPALYYYTDCAFFAGCENMLANFLEDDELRSRFKVTFVYRHSALYEAGYKARVKKSVESLPVKLLNIGDYVDKASSGTIRTALRVVSALLLLKYWSVIINTVRLYRVFTREKIDILHVNNGGYPGAYSCMSAVFAARLAKVERIVYVVNNVAFPYALPGRWLDWPLDRLVARSVSVFVTGSKFALGRLTDVLGIAGQKGVSLYNGIARRPVNESIDAAHLRFSVRPGRAVLAMVAVFEERKGHIYLLKAVRRLVEMGLGDSFVLLIEGSGGVRGELESYVKDAGIAENVKFVGAEKSVFNLMNAADVIVLPSTEREDFPNVVIEAMSLGKPVVASNISGVPEQITHMENGLLVEPRDVEGLAGALALLLNDEGLKLRLGRNALERYEKRFSARAAVERYMELYSDLLKRGQ